jgi:hypothetical protein
MIVVRPMKRMSYIAGIPYKHVLVDPGNKSEGFKEPLCNSVVLRKKNTFFDCRHTIQARLGGSCEQTRGV